MKGWWFSLGTLVSSPNKTYRHDKTEILLEVVLNTLILTHLGHGVHLDNLYPLLCTATTVKPALVTTSIEQ